MAKKNLLGDFEFKKFDNLNNGIEIPVSNSLKVKKESEEKNAVPTKPVEQKKVVSKEEKRTPIDLPNLNYIDKEQIKPLVNVVPTSSPKKVVSTNTPKVVPTSAPKKQTIVDSDINLSEYGALKSKDEKVLYLAMRGWSLKVEQRRNGFFHYATKYISRKKKRIYLGSINES